MEKNRDNIRDFLNKIIVLKKELENYEDMREQVFFRIDQLDLEFDSSKYDDFRLIISECDYHIERVEDMIEQLWQRIDQEGGLDAVFEETLA